MPVVGIRSLKKTVVLLHSLEFVEELSLEEFLSRDLRFFDKGQKRSFLRDMDVNDREYVWQHPHLGYCTWEHSLSDAVCALEEAAEDFDEDE